jgi:hypothetical protein
MQAAPVSGCARTSSFRAHGGRANRASGDSQVAVHCDPLAISVAVWAGDFQVVVHRDLIRVSVVVRSDSVVVLAGDSV